MYMLLHTRIQLMEGAIGVKKDAKKLEILKAVSPASLVRQIRTDKKAFCVYLVLMLLVIAVMLYSIFVGQWESVFICALTSILFFIPPFVEKTFRVELPTMLEVIALIFVFCAEILGEIAGFYTKFPIWDNLLHSVNGLMFAAFGFCLVDVFNRNKKFRFELSPLYLALFSFCFSMTIGVLWEFFEFGMDSFANIDMQKDRLVQDIYSVWFDPQNNNNVQAYPDIVSTTFVTESGQVVTMPGYLDIGLFDTMKDLMINFIGAVIFSVIGYFYIKQRGKGKFASHFIPVFLEEAQQGEEQLIADVTAQVPVETAGGQVSAATTTTEVN